MHAHLFEQDCGVDGLGEDVKRVTFQGGAVEEFSRTVVAGDEQDAAMRQHLLDGNRGVKQASIVFVLLLSAAG